MSLNLNKSITETVYREGASVIYFIGTEDSEAIKIGWTKGVNPNHRLAEFQVGNGSKLKGLGMMHGSRKEEGRLHRTFRAYRLHGEWFAGSPDLLTFINHNTRAFPKVEIQLEPKQKPRPNIAKFLIDKYEWTVVQIAYRVGCRSRSVENWYSGKVKPIEIFQKKLEKIYKQEVGHV